MSKKLNSANKEEESIYHQRLSAVAEAVGTSSRQFGVRIGMSLGYVGSVGDDIALSVATKILDVYPNVSIKYLMYGEGDILVPPSVNFESSKEDGMSLLDYLQKKVAMQESSINKLHQEIGRLKALLDNKKDCALQADSAMDAVANQ